MTDTGRVTEAGMIGSHDDDPDSESGIRGAVRSPEFASSTTSPTTMASYASAAGGGGTSPPKKIIEAPETPLWRFINMAKKREGYSSTAAGTIVEGLSAQELAGKFVPPAWKPSGEASKGCVDVGRSEWDKDEARGKEARDVGRLDRKNAGEGDEAVEETFEYARPLSMVLSASTESFRVYVHDDEEEGSAAAAEEWASKRDDSAMMSRGVSGTLNISVDERTTSEIEMEEAAMRQSRISFPVPTTADEEQLILVEKQQTTKEDGLILTVDGDKEPPPPPPQPPAAVIPYPTCQSLSFEDNSKRSNKKRWALLSVLLVVASVAVVGIFLAGEITEKENSTVETLGVNTTSQTPIPSLYPSAMPSNKPVYNPSSQPTMSPSSYPTEKPVCDVNYEAFNLCIAIDMSGSVCNSDTGFECVACEPELICYDSLVDKGTCCRNFYDLIEFTKSMINTLSTISSESSFSIVPFATNAELVSSLVSADEALDSLDAITFTGGRTNHAAAIISCRTSLESSPESDRKNLLLLITDGSPSEPEGLPGFAADIAAADAKSVGIFIIPTTIKQEVSPYLQRMSSDGTAFYASDFDVVDSLQEILLAQVSCQV